MNLCDLYANVTFKWIMDYGEGGDAGDVIGADDEMFREVPARFVCVRACMRV